MIAACSRGRVADRPFAHFLQAITLPKRRSVSRWPQRLQTLCRALVSMLSWPKK
jgi:hypothetical protein